ncbi:hypothetical protein ACFSMW_07150 [Virgibacillus halophilus]|uniref:Lipoprotein n=1 Tax=Tigheibacillus halophilus TaxID=361280 RepID=A0ABU5C7N6_9BACI|nr:hypothetical protein [Virgibacillus halophilus]
MTKRIILLLGCILVLTACGKSHQETGNPENNEHDSQSSKQADQHDEDTNTDEESVGDAGDKIDDTAEEMQDEQKGNMEDVTKMPEYKIIKGQVVMDDYRLNVVEDNRHKRVIILQNKDNHRKEYKSIFMKEDGRLKLIQFNSNGLIYDKTIQ